MAQAIGLCDGKRPYKHAGDYCAGLVRISCAVAAIYESDVLKDRRDRRDFSRDPLQLFWRGWMRAFTQLKVRVPLCQGSRSPLNLLAFKPSSGGMRCDGLHAVAASIWLSPKSQSCNSGVCAGAADLGAANMATSRGKNPTLCEDGLARICICPKWMLRDSRWSSVSNGDALRRGAIFSICPPDMRQICGSSTAAIGRAVAIGLVLRS